MASSVALRQALTVASNLRVTQQGSCSPVSAAPSISQPYPPLSVSKLKQGRTHVVSATADAETTAAASTANWVPVIPLEALPKGERRIVRQDGQEILLLWYRSEIYAIGNVSPAEGAYSEGLYNARLTQDGCIVCPTTESTFALSTGEIKDWYPRNPIMRAITKPLRGLEVFPVKVSEDYQVLISTAVTQADQVSSEVVMGGNLRVGRTASELSVDEIKMIVDETQGGFGFSAKNELLNGRAAMGGFVLLLMIELVTGKGLLATTGFLDFIYKVSGGGPQ